MSGISSYILTVAGVILISIVVELVMSEGALSKYIKSIFSFFVLAVIISPIPSLISDDGVKGVFEFSDYEIQEGYIYTLNKSRLETMAKEEEVFLESEGYKDIQIIFFSNNMAEAEMIVSGVSINLSELVILENASCGTKEGVKEYLVCRYKEEFEIQEGGIVYEG